MKRYAVAFALLTAASAAQAGSYDAPADPPVMPPVIVEDDAAASSMPSAGLVLGLAALIVFGVAAGN